MQGKVGRMYMQTAGLHKMPELNVPNLHMKPQHVEFPNCPTAPCQRKQITVLSQSSPKCGTRRKTWPPHSSPSIIRSSILSIKNMDEDTHVILFESWPLNKDQETVAKKISFDLCNNSWEIWGKVGELCQSSEKLWLGELGAKDHMSPSISHEKFREAPKKLATKRKNLSVGKWRGFSSIRQRIRVDVPN